MKCRICGMEINEQNYNFNESAFTNKNSIDNIIYCPFCGVGKEYLSEDCEVITVKSNLLSENALKILDHAVKLELFNGEFYNTAASMCNNLEIKKIFQALSRIEIFHSKLHQRLGGFTKAPNLIKVSYERCDSDNTLLELAKKKEEHAVSYYEKYKNEVYNDNLFEIFKALADVEREHIILVEE
ncbi:rubrerythrin [Clostridium puniceum]|uniref:Rubrerythrin n=1 Tax=Clostridium puniceum TaxID=29367 RepID=A0A1S8TVX4_9CLOT|nr:ferritin-like domain-containing protein [Clostridium puniceum]OOM81907.1 rubrerythrin [Clostridium puniceum]